MPGLSGALGWNYTHLSGAGTTDIFTGIGATQATSSSPANVGMYGGVILNTAGTSVTVLDGAGNTLAAYGAITGDFSRTTGIQLKNGLRVTIVGAADVTVLWA
jgi:hypothetical protein